MSLWRTEARGWLITSLFVALLALAYVDRFILALIASPVTESLHISDTGMGLLLGAGFAIVYTFSGLPLAQLMDRGPRRWVLFLSIVLWSCMTIASGFVDSYIGLLICRTGVAIGEAAVTPAAVSLIAESFSDRRRELPMAIYSSVSNVMGTGAFIAGGIALKVATDLSPAWDLEPWRITFVIVGIPGIILAAIAFILVRARKERVIDNPASDNHTSPHNTHDFKTFSRYFFRNSGVYLWLFMGVSFIAIAQYAYLSWMPSLLTRGFALDPSRAGYLIGLFGMPAGVAGTFFWSLTSRKLESAGYQHSIIITYLIASLLAIPLLVFAPTAKAELVVMAGLSGFVFCGASSTVLAFLAIQKYGPPEMRARLVALFALFVNLPGYVVGPALVPIFAALWPSDPRALGYGLAVLGAITGPMTTTCFLICRWHLKRVSLADLHAY